MPNLILNIAFHFQMNRSVVIDSSFHPGCNILRAFFLELSNPYTHAVLFLCEDDQLSSEKGGECCQRNSVDCEKQEAMDLCVGRRG